MFNPYFSPLVIALNLLLATSLPENLFSPDDTLHEPNTLLSFLDEDLDQDLSDSIDYSLLNSGFDASETDPFSTPSDDDLLFANIFASTPSQSSCQADNDLTSKVLQGRDSSSSLPCPEFKKDEPLKLPLDLFNDAEGTLRGIYPNQVPDETPPKPGTYAPSQVDLQRLPMYLGRCINPFIFQVCCDGGLRSSTTGSISEIYSCYWNFVPVSCDKPFQACCTTFVSKPSYRLKLEQGT